MYYNAIELSLFLSTNYYFNVIYILPILIPPSRIIDLIHLL
jgi:hypothetical protein